MNSRYQFWIKSTYFSFFVSYGVFLVYLNLHYKRIGLSAEQIGVLSALYPLVGILINPLWGMAADRSPDPRRIVRRLLFASAILFGVLFLLKDFGLIFLVILSFAICYSPVISLTDALTLGTLAKWGGDYGRMRLWGSLGFIFPAFVLWGILNWRDDLRVIFPLFFITTVAAGAVLGQFPHLKRPVTAGLNLSALHLLREPMFLIFLGAGFFHNLAMSGYYAFFSIYLDDLHVASSYTGFFWAIGPIAETAALSLVGGYIARWGVKRVLLLSFAATAVRLGVLSIAPPVIVILISQTLHALTFGTYHAASLHYLAQKASDENRASVQALYTAICLQLATVVGYSLSGVLVQHWGVLAMFRVYALIALVSTVGFGVLFREEHGTEVSTPSLFHGSRRAQ